MITVLPIFKRIPGCMNEQINLSSSSLRRNFDFLISYFSSIGLLMSSDDNDTDDRAEVFEDVDGIFCAVIISYTSFSGFAVFFVKSN